MDNDDNPYRSPATTEEPLARRSGGKRRTSYYGALAIGSALVALASQFFLPWPYPYRTSLTAAEAFRTFLVTLVMVTAIVMAILFSLVGMLEPLFRRRN